MNKKFTCAIKYDSSNSMLFKFTTTTKNFNNNLIDKAHLHNVKLIYKEFILSTIKNLITRYITIDVIRIQFMYLFITHTSLAL